MVKRAVRIVCLIVSMTMIWPALDASAASRSPKVLVFGGTGMVGLAIVKELRQRGYETTVFVRASSNLKDIEAVSAAHVVGDVMDLDTVLVAIKQQKYDTVISAVARPAGAAGDQAVTIYATGNDNITQAAKRTHVRQVVLMGTVGAGDSRGAITEQHFESAKNIFRDKTEGEQTLLKSGLTYTIIRTGLLLGGQSVGTGMLSQDQSLREPMRLGDVAREVANCVMTKRCFNKIFHAVDPTLKSMSPDELLRERRMINEYKKVNRSESISPETQR